MFILILFDFFSGDRDFVRLGRLKEKEIEAEKNEKIIEENKMFTAKKNEVKIEKITSCEGNENFDIDNNENINVEETNILLENLTEEINLQKNEDINESTKISMNFSAAMNQSTDYRRFGETRFGELGYGGMEWHGSSKV